MRLAFKSFTIYFLVMPSLLLAQPEKVDTAMMRRIREEGLVHSQVGPIAEQLTDIAGSRLTNSPGYKRAGDWAVSALKQWGLENAKMEAWGEFGYGWSVEKLYVSLRSPYYEPVIGYAKPWSGSTGGLLSAPVFLLEKLDSAFLEKNASSIRGKIILYKNKDTSLGSAFKAYASRYSDSDLAKLGDSYMFTSQMLHFFMPQVLALKKTKKMLKEEGALALVDFDENGRDGTVFVDGFGGYKKGDQPALPEIVISKEAYLKFERLVEAGKSVVMELEIQTQLYKEDTKGYNLVAEIPGVDPLLKDEVVILGGHMDSWQSATGATDNGAGCIVMMEAIRILKALRIQPKRTIRIALWGGEEQGLIGSFNYVKNHFGDPATMQLKPEQKKVSAYFNLDNGTGKIRGIYDQGNKAVIPVFSKWFEPFNDLGAATVTSHNTGATDHLSFDAVGIPGFQFIQDPIEYEKRTHHSNMDTYDHLMLDDLKQAATIVAAFVYNTAMRSEKLPRKQLPKPEKFLFEEFLEF
jgi:carboxypeptidase Q